MLFLQGDKLISVDAVVIRRRVTLDRTFANGCCTRPRDSDSDASNESGMIADEIESRELLAG